MAQKQFFKYSMKNHSPAKDFILFFVGVVIMTTFIAISLSSMIYFSHLRSVEKELTSKGD